MTKSDVLGTYGDDGFSSRLKEVENCAASFY